MVPTDQSTNSYCYFILGQEHSPQRCKTPEDDGETPPSPRSLDENEMEEEIIPKSFFQLNKELEELYNLLAYCNARKACWVPIAQARLKEQIKEKLAEIEQMLAKS